MKISRFLIPGTIVVFLAIVSFIGCGNDAIGPDPTATPVSADGLALQAYLTDEDMTWLIFMREEEKLARDVYLVMYDMYGLKWSGANH